MPTEEKISAAVGLLFLMFIALVLFGALSGNWTVFNILRPAPRAQGTDTAVLPADMLATPDRFWTGSMPDGWDGYVGYGAIWVDKDRRVWIAPDWAVTKKADVWGDDLHIQRQGDHMVLFKNSTGRYTWQPGVDSGWHVDQKTGLIPVIVR